MVGIRIYPFKSLNPVECHQSEITSAGALSNDRRFALVTSDGAFFNAKRAPRFHQLRLETDPSAETLTISLRGESTGITVKTTAALDPLEKWLSHQFGRHLQVQESPVAGFPDDLKAPGPTLISTATIETISSWYPELTPANIRDRLRTNLEIDGVPPFWEDCLFAENPNQSVEFSIGDCQFEGLNPCQRCAVPSRDPLTGRVLKNFVKTFTTNRKKTLPSWAAKGRFDHFYQVSINTRPKADQSNKEIKIGDPVHL
ncbi:MAG: hypothetical protein M2R45_02593 [Verrucomicrobia subdivision 3 bacterium]|nr:hypothetical protein [Limisphaerales bacterium]MCS1416437.1 hypothetical protein [Limisphaerales bacterium]